MPCASFTCARWPESRPIASWKSVVNTSPRSAIGRRLWMGEFGRTPRINEGRNGRDHFPSAFSAALAGGGVKGGQLIGATNAEGTDIAQRPVPDLFCSFCHALKINPRKQ